MSTTSQIRTERKSETDTRTRILWAAFEEFYKHGFQSGSLNHIVENSGTTKGALFHYFENKNALGYAVLDEVIGPLGRQRWIEPLAAAPDPIGAVEETLRSHMKEDMDSGHFRLGCPLNNLAQEMSPLDEGFRKRIEGYYSEWRGAIVSALERGMKSGKVKPSVSPTDVASLVVAGQMGIWGTGKNSQCVELMKAATEGLCGYLESLRA